jgi:hypothetical protein
MILLLIVICLLIIICDNKERKNIAEILLGILLIFLVLHYFDYTYHIIYFIKRLIK